MQYLDAIFLQLMAAALIAITAIVHSVLDEKRLITPDYGKRNSIDTPFSHTAGHASCMALDHHAVAWHSRSAGRCRIWQY
ncbi:hypothetical protein CP97_10545 [Aurantiacibacter atlanticus]|uniref:Uncharacterized protein n=1 Tax=Aurantiacibacter atlanticus TaxID=1648404 RepID=A0A0H4VDF1_9SPHN|nr:hypothetical protein [Aurantiacibacter atlanticus]AKQ42370.1 hypothetical protein CP97_10545 [Aurantiacibacter atlanticus]MDF1834515.1 hypothetical protein [Alteraurantiacibacter sp. bin_em_oilr2.035]